MNDVCFGGRGGGICAATAAGRLQKTGGRQICTRRCFTWAATGLHLSFSLYARSFFLFQNDSDISCSMLCCNISQRLQRLLSPLSRTGGRAVCDPSCQEASEPHLLQQMQHLLWRLALLAARSCSLSSECRSQNCWSITPKRGFPSRHPQV